MVHSTKVQSDEGTQREAMLASLPWYVRLLASQSPLGYNAGDANLYRYVGNSPTNALDPLGLIKEDEGLDVRIETKDRLAKLAVKVLTLMRDKNNEFVTIRAFRVKEITEDCKSKCLIEYRVYGFEVAKDAAAFNVALKITGIDALDTFITKLPEKLREVKLDGKVQRINEVSVEKTRKLEGKCKDITLDDVKKTFQYDLLVNASKAALDRLGTKDELPGDLATIYEAAGLFWMFESLRP